MDVGHAPLAPSSGFQWRYCPGSVIMQTIAGPSKDTEASEEGNAAHWLAAEWLNGADPGALVGKPAPNGHVITLEIVKYVRVFVEAVQSIVANNEDAELWVEYRVGIASVHPDCWGTFDIGIYIRSTKTLYILDLKYGWGVVEVEDNEQLQLYGLGFVEELVTQRARPVENLKLGVIQPRAYHRDGPVRIIDLPKAALRPFLDEMKIAAPKALDPGAQCVTGPHCKNCDARQICPALRSAADHAMDFIEVAQPEVLSPHDLGLYLVELDKYEALIKARRKSLKNQAESYLASGQAVPGFTIGFGRSTREWNQTDEYMKTTGQLIGVSFSKEVMLSPAQVETAGVDKKIVSQYVTKKPGKPTLKAGDPSELAKRIFNQ